METYIIKSYNNNISNFKDNNNTSFVCSWMEEILTYIDKMHQEIKNIMNKYITDEKTSLNKSKVQKCDDLDIFTSKDIQDKNNAIKNDFMQFSINFINDEDDKENQTLGTKLFQIAKISRYAYNDSNKVLSLIYKEFEKKENKDIIITSPDQFRKNFSNWVKMNEQYKNQYFNDFVNKFSSQKFLNDEKIKDYFIKLYKDLLVLYFLCELSFPSVKIEFLNEDEFFNSGKMIDIFQIRKKGQKSKVNFVYFPSLFSNGNYLENGKKWVFNFIYNEKKGGTFFFESNKLSQLTPLTDETKKFHIPKINDKLKIELIKNISYSPKTNYSISDNINKKYFIQTIDKNTKKINEYQFNSSFNLKLKDNEEIIKLQLYLFNEQVQEIKYKNIKDES
jgi:hypothetical protein